MLCQLNFYLTSLVSMWTSINKEIQNDRITQFTILQDGKTLTFKEVIQLWIENPDFRKFYNDILVTCPYSAFFWENPPADENSVNSPYEFVLVDSTTLARISSQSRAFETYFKTGKKVVVFPNLGKDATLIVPCPQEDHEHYSHLANFVRNAPIQQIDEYWKVVGETFQNIIGPQKKWLSTSGLGVYWLHARIDSRPKYYQYQTYKVG